MAQKSLVQARKSPLGRGFRGG